ncbi:MAG: acyl-CoA dehydrogenase family protein, partial [Gammaproteobacteria bacterium]
MASFGWASFDWEDPFLIAQELSEEERMVMQTARDYAQAKLAPRVREAYRNESADPAIFREMGE